MKWLTELLMVLGVALVAASLVIIVATVSYTFFGVTGIVVTHIAESISIFFG